MGRGKSQYASIQVRSVLYLAPPLGELSAEPSERAFPLLREFVR